MKLDGAVIVMTGGGGGVGAALVDAFAKEGAAAIIIGDRDPAAAEAVASRHAGQATTVIGLAADVARQDDIDRLAGLGLQRFGRIDLFCSNAGLLIDGGLDGPLADWDLSWSVNVMAHVHAARAALPGMLARGSGHFLNVTSAAGLLTAPGAAAYATTKHAAVGFAEWLAIAYGDRGIGVSVLCTEAVRTKMLSVSMAKGNEGVRRVAETTVVLEPAEVADATIAGLKADRFLVLSHRGTLAKVQKKWADPDRWIGGMRRYLRD